MQNVGKSDVSEDHLYNILKLESEFCLMSDDFLEPSDSDDCTQSDI